MIAKATGSVLIVDDDPAVGKVLGAILRQDGMDAQHVASGVQALTCLESHLPDVVISDLKMPGMDGMALLHAIGERYPELPVILLTAHGTVATAVEAMKRGAADFLLKPFDRDEILFVVRKALQVSEPARAALPASSGTKTKLTPSGMAGAMSDVHATIARAAPTLATVLIRGETGTGKELVARAIHEQSPRAAKPFVKVHCAALPDQLLESELFGYEKGAFTGASARKPGRIELAEGGTLFLDEIGDVSPATQVKLLRILQDREYERLGGTQTLKADVRFVAATHRDLDQMISHGEFREDLYYRLNVVPILVPPLRERSEQIEALALRACEEASQLNRCSGKRLSRGALAALRKHPWPGNVRQLRNVIERLVVLTEADEITEQEVTREFTRHPMPSRVGGETTFDSARQEAERVVLVRALERAGNNRALAARVLGISRRTLYNRLEKFGLL